MSALPDAAMVIAFAKLLALLSGARLAGAQPFAATPPGDRAVADDSIYRLAVNPVDYPDLPFIYLLDDAIVRFEAGGRGTMTYRQVVQVLTRDAVDTWAEHTFSYLEGRERLRIDWIRVVKPDGTVISDRPSHEQETSEPVPEAYPVYSDEKIRRVSLGGVAPGTLVDVSYTLEILEPLFPGDFWATWAVTTWQPVRRSRLIVDLPAHLEPRIAERNLDFQRRIELRNGRRLYVWARSDVPPLDVEPFAPPPDKVGMSVTVASPLTWDRVARWYGDLAADRYVATPALDSALATVVAGRRSLDDSLRAAHRWIAQDIRYVSLALGRGGHQPRPPAEVLSTGFGDCKDKATLFIAAARRFGVDAYPVLVNLDDDVDSLMPSIQQFDHVVAALATPKGYHYLDLTAELIPWGQVPDYLQGEVGLLVRADGGAELVRFPEDPPEANRLVQAITGELRPDGTFRGRYALAASGTLEHELRDLLTGLASLTAEEQRRAAQSLTGKAWEGARADSLEASEGRDLDAEPRISTALAVAKATQPSGADHILTLPLRNRADPALLEELERGDNRRFPIDLAELNGPSVERETLDVLLPDGWRAELPLSVSVTGVFGSYTAHYAQEGRWLRIVRELAGRKGTQPSDSLGALIRWLRGVAQDDVRYLVLKPAASKR